MSIRRIAIAGAGSVGWLAGCALRRALKHRDLDVLVIGTAPPACEPRVRATLPSLRGLHAMLGVGETEFLQATGATYRLASEHRGWRGDGTVFLHPFGELGVEIGGAAFYKYLLSEALAGRGVSPEPYSLAALAALNGRFARPMGEGAALTASFTYGFHVEEAPYAAYLRSHAGKLGVRSAPADVADVELAPDGGIAALRLTSGERVEADIYLDCSGSDATLISRLDANARVDWRASLPCDRQLTVFGPVIADSPAMTQTQATDAGWFWRAPLATRAAAGYVYCSELVSDERAQQALTGAAGGTLDATLLNLRAGRRTQPWSRNCVALGAAALELEPLAGVDLQSAALGLGAFIELFPASAVSGVEAVEYNRVMAEHFDGLRDFVLAHYHAGAAPALEFWDRLRAVPLPDRLAHKLSLYFANGRIEILDFETFEETDWAWLLLGSRRAPRSLEMQIQGIVAPVKPAQVAPLRDELARLVSSMPRHMDFVRHQNSLQPRMQR